MSSKISLWTGLIGIGVKIAIVQPNIASAKSSVKIADTAKEIGVLITEQNNVGLGVITNPIDYPLGHQHRWMLRANSIRTSVNL
jgi:hypothetical protein